MEERSGRCLATEMGRSAEDWMSERWVCFVLRRFDGGERPDALVRCAIDFVLVEMLKSLSVLTAPAWVARQIRYWLCGDRLYEENCRRRYAAV